MKIVLLDGEKIRTAKEMHAVFAETLFLPDYFGSNLDALHDVLTDIREEIGVVAVNTPLLQENLGRRWRPFCRLMEDLTEERPGFHWCPDPFAE